MSRSGLILVLVCLVLGGALGLVWWQMKDIPPVPLRPEVRGSALGIGLGQGERRLKNGIEIYSPSVLLWNTEAAVIRFEDEGFEPRPIASITKLMTAMVALDVGIDWDQEVTILPEEYLIGSKLMLHPGERVTMRDLWHAMLMGSANNATVALVRSLDIDESEFVRAMNRKAIELNLEQTKFVEVTGLDDENVSTAYEVARLAEAAFRDYPLIAETTRQKEYNFVLGGSGRNHTLGNSNKMVTDGEADIIGGKTGYLDEAGYCLVVWGGSQTDDKIVVVLGSPSEWANRQDIETMFNYGSL